MVDVIRVVAAVIEHGGRFLITQRRPEAVLPLLWEFPGGRVEPGESDEEALVREVHERLGIQLSVGRQMSRMEHAYDEYSVTLLIFRASIAAGEPSRKHINDYRWVTSEEFDEYSFPPADQKTMDLLLGLRDRNQ